VNDSGRFLGFTVYCDFIQSEGIDAVLDNLDGAGATAVAINPTVTEPSAEGEGVFQPPDDAGSSPRLFDRPLWGHRSLWVRGGPSYTADEKRYSGCRYRPRQANDLTARSGHIIGDFIKAARGRGLSVYFQLSGTAPPGLRDEDVPRLPDGRIPIDRMAATASLASEDVRDYVTAYVDDLLQHYPDITGFRPDWPEYPCYKLDELFQDFSPHVEAWCTTRDIDFQPIRAQVAAFYQYIHGSLTNKDLEELVAVEPGKVVEAEVLRRFPLIVQWLHMKSALSVDLLAHWRTAITRAAGPDIELSANAFMPPFSAFTGFDFRPAAEHCTAVSPKFYTMHWALMLHFWGTDLLRSNPGIDENLLVRALANLFDMGVDTTSARLDDFHYPEPDEPHPVSDAAQSRKIAQVLEEVDSAALVTPIVHGYGPDSDFARRFAVAAQSATDGVWINRYGYLGDEKLAAIGELWP
jgi:hypothetical protein